MSTPQFRPKVFTYPVVLTDHVFEKVRSIDMTLAEFRACLLVAEVIEATDLGTGGLKELVLTLEWTRPLHVVVVVDTGRQEERIVTVYEPDPARWTDNSRRRRP